MQEGGGLGTVFYFIDTLIYVLRETCDIIKIRYCTLNFIGYYIARDNVTKM